MKNILEAPFIKEVMLLTDVMYKFGWHERNSGNLSYLLKKEELTEYLDLNEVKRNIPIAFDGKALAGKYFLVTGTGKFFKNVIHDPADVLGLLKVTAEGSSVDLLWGYENGAAPTSELPAHLMSHIARLSVDPENRVVYHCHATNLLAMSFSCELDERSFTRILWKMCTESLVVFPEGVGILPWLMPGTNEIGEATAEKMKEYRLIVWPHHGLYAAGKDLEECFGLVETAEKSATVYTLVQSQGGIRQEITDEQLSNLGKRFSVTPRAGYLNI